MINRQNWMDTNAWLHHLEHNLGRHTKTIQKYRVSLRHLLEWADEKTLPNARLIDPAFPTYLITARNDGKAVRLSYTSMYKTLATARSFFQYARMEWPPRYAKLSDSWVNLLYPNANCKPAPQLDDHQFYTIEEMYAIAAVSTETLREARAQAAACLLFLSGMRSDTLCSLPIQCVDIPNRRIYQIPSMGPRTKNNKAAITYLLEIPELLAVITAWHNRLQELDPKSLWYPILNHDGMQLIESARAIEGRSGSIRDDLPFICKKAAVKYLSPHKFRHGHIVYARNRARNMGELKAISQNVMHANSIITDQIYGGLTSNQVQSVISRLGTQEQDNKSDILLLIEKLKAQL